MNRFGIRLAAGLAVVCLGSLAIFQAQQDKNSQLRDDWPSASDVAANEPPAPLGVSSDWPALPDEAQDTVIRGNNFGADEAYAMPQNGFPADASNAREYQNTGPGGVSLASFDQPADEAPSGSETNAASTPSTNSSFAEPPAIDVPQTAPPTLGAPQLASENNAGNAPGDLAADGPLDYPQTAGTQMRLSPLPANDYQDEPAAATSAYDPDQYAPNQYAPNQYAAADGPQQQAPASSAFASPNSLALTPLPVDDTEIDQAGPTNQAGSPAAIAPQNTTFTTPPNGSGYAVTEGQQTTQAAPASDPLENAAANWQQPNGFSQPTAPIGSGLAPLPTGSGEPPRIASNAMNSVGSRGAGVAASGYSPVLSQLQTIDIAEVLAEPGTRDLEGAQTPSVLVQKRAPGEIRVGKPAEFVINVKNVGTVPALDVRVFDTVPNGTRLESSLPPAEKVEDLLVWQLGDLGPGDERSIRVSLIPEVEGEVGSVARVTFEAAASVRTVATRPNVEFTYRAPEQVLIGQQIEIDVEIKNTGTGTADNVVVLAELPEGLDSPNGRSLKLPIGSMAPGAMHRDVLRLRATQPGLLTGQFRISDSDGVIDDADMNVQVISPKLDVALQGPSMRYLERQATYKVQIANNGTADASDIDLIVYLDRGLKFVSTEYQGKYDPDRHAVFWALEELRANEVGEVPLTLLPVEPGVQKVRVETTGALGISAKSERELAIETLAELSFTIADDQDPIEPGAFTTYEVRVKNTGSRDDTNVILEVQIPYPGLELVMAEPSAGTDGRGKVIFEPIARIPAKGEQVYRVRVKGVQPDTHVMRATVVSSQSKRPVTKEESTTVYQDQ